MLGELKQRKLFQYKHFILYKDRLYYKNKMLANSVELEIPFENLTNHLVLEKKFDYRLWLVAGFFLVVFITKTIYLFTDPEFDYDWYFISFVLLMIFSFLAYMSTSNVTYVTTLNPPAIEIMNDSPNVGTVKDFYTLLRNTSKEHLLNKFVFNLEATLEDQKHNLHHLKDLKIINEDEVERIIEELECSLPHKRNKIGFKPTSNQ